MKITVNKLGKRYNKEWIFRNLDLEVKSGGKIAITGYNGSGKSTLLKILSGYTLPSEGTVGYGGAKADSETQTDFNFCAPYLNLIEEFTLLELLRFHKKFKEPVISEHAILKRSGLFHAQNKLIREFSSGMKQRLRLSLAFFFQSQIIFLDEPTSNLDEQGAIWYRDLVQLSPENQTILVASNQQQEYSFCEEIISIEKWK